MLMWQNSRQNVKPMGRSDDMLIIKGVNVFPSPDRVSAS